MNQVRAEGIFLEGRSLSFAQRDEQVLHPGPQLNVS